MIITRNIIFADHNIEVLAFQITEVSPLVITSFYRFDHNDGITGLLEIEVDNAWSPAEDAALDAVLAAPTVGIIVFRAQPIISDYQVDSPKVPVSTNSTAWQAVFGTVFNTKDNPGTYRVQIQFRFAIDSASQRAEFRYVVDTVPSTEIHRQEMKDPQNLLYVTMTFDLPDLPLRTFKQIDFEYRKQNGAALVTVDNVAISVKKIK